MQISSALDLLPLTDYTHFFNRNEEEDENEFQQFLDATFAEHLQLEEALKASLLQPCRIPASGGLSNMPVEMRGESSLSFCQFCNERKENDQLKKSEKCGHLVCFDCSKAKRGNCPILSCDPVPLKSDTFKQFLPEDMISLREKAPSTDPISNLNYRQQVFKILKEVAQLLKTEETLVCNHLPLVLHRFERKLEDKIESETNTFIHHRGFSNMEISSALDLLPLTDYTHFFNRNEEEDENEFQQFLDATFSEHLQLEEALKASLLTCRIPASGGLSNMPVEMRGESSLRFCQFCNERKENDQLKKSEKCGHLVCFDCSKAKKGNCPILSCDPVPLESDTFKQFLPEDMIFLREKAPSTDPISNLNYSNGLSAKMDSKSTKLIIPGRKYKAALTSSDRNKTMDSRRDKEPKQVYSYVKNTPPLVIASSPCDEWPASAATGANVDDSSSCDEWPVTDDYDSDASPRSPESCRKSKWFKNFDRELEIISNRREMNDLARQWYCPACQGCPQAFTQYLGLQTLTQHAIRKHSTRGRLHLELAQLIKDRLKSEAVASDPAAKPCRKWKGLKEDKKDHEIVWPPMVVISYTMHKMDENTEWIGMTNQEVMDMFSSYDAIVNARQCHPIEGYCGMSILVFESSVIGYLEAVRLHKHFADQGTERNAWHSQSVHFLSSRDQQVYGYLALREDVDTFNNHKSAKHQLKYEMRSYQEMVVNQIKQMCVENHQLVWLRNRVDEQEKQAKEFEQSYDMLKEKLQIAKKESDIMRRKVAQQHEQHMEEVEYQEQFFKEQIGNILASRKENDRDLEKAPEVEDQENGKQFSNRMLQTESDPEYKKRRLNEQGIKIKNREA